MTAQSTQPTHQEMRQKKARWVVLTVGALVLAREHWWRSVSMSGFARRRVSHILRSGEHRAFGAPMNGNCTLWTLRVAWLKAFSLLRFFVALDKEMTCRHAQWLIVIKRKSDSRRPLTLKATTRHLPQPLTPEPSNSALPHPKPAHPQKPQNPSIGASENHALNLNPTNQPSQKPDQRLKQLRRCIPIPEHEPVVLGHGPQRKTG